MATYTYSQIVDLWKLYGGPADVAPIAAAIAMAESGGRSDAIANEPNGSISRGLFQINSVHGLNSSTDVAINVRAAVQLYNSKHGFSDWTTYNTGAYRKFLAGANPLDYLADSQSSTEALFNPLDGLSSIADTLKKIVEGATWITDRHNVIRIAEVIIGGGLILVGIAILNFSLVKDVVGDIASVAAKVPIK